MIAYEPEAWHDLFVTTGGAAATLAGLIFVAVSLNHEAILAIPALPALAARTISILIALLLLCLVGLIPGQTTTALGLEVLIIGGSLTTMVLGTTLRDLSGSARRRWRFSLVGLAVVGSLPATIAGISLLVRAGGGLYWLLVEFVFGIAVAVYYGWALLIEIRR